MTRRDAGRSQNLRKLEPRMRVVLTTYGSRGGARAGAPQVVGAPGGGPALLGRPGGRPGHRRSTRRSDSHHRVPVSRAQDDPDPRDPRTSDPAVAGTIRTDGATVAATLLVNDLSRVERA